ncbi:MAG: lysozyme inhibitor LprI family protein [Hyphomicrobiaceae bacterium]
MMKRFLIALSAVATSMFAVLAAPVSANAASFSCMNSEYMNLAERRVCHSRTLSVLDERLDSWYRRALVRAKYFDDTMWVRAQQRRWMKKRNACGWRYWCLRRAYKKRIRTLKRYVEHV